MAQRLLRKRRGFFLRGDTVQMLLGFSSNSTLIQMPFVVIRTLEERLRYLRELEARPENHVGLLNEFAASGEPAAGKETVDLSKINSYA